MNTPNPYRSENKDYYILLPLVGILAVYLLSRLWGPAITCWDDAAISVMQYKYGSVWTGSFAVATSQGRFYQLLTFPLTEFSHTWNSFGVYNVFRIGSCLIPFLAFALLIRSFINTRTSLFACTILLALLETGYSFNPFHALPLWFNLGLGFSLFAMLFFWKHLETRSVSSMAVSVFFYFMSMLTYEPFLLYGISFVIILFCRYGNSIKPTRKSIIENLRILAPQITIAVLYLIIYCSFRAVYHSNYEGTKMSMGSISSMVATVIRLSIGGLNWTGIFALLLPKEYQQVSIGAIIPSLLAGGATTYFLQRLKNDAELSRKVQWLGIIGVLFIFLPNVLLAFTERYRDVRIFPTYYLTTFYSGFAMVLSLCGAMLWLVRLMDRLKLGAAASIVLGMVISVFAYSNLAESDRVYAYYKLERNKWAIADLISEYPFPKRDVVLYFPQLSNFREADPYDYWSCYLSAKTSKNIVVTNQLADGVYEHPGGPTLLAAWAEYSIGSGKGSIMIGTVLEQRQNTVTIKERHCLAIKSVKVGGLTVLESDGVNTLKELAVGEKRVTKMESEMLTFKYENSHRQREYSRTSYAGNRDLKIASYLIAETDKDHWNRALQPSIKLVRFIILKNMLIKYGDAANYSRVEGIWKE